MKPSTLNFATLVAAFVASGSVAFSQTATTDPVGFLTVNVAAGTGTAKVLSFKALGLTRPTEYQGLAETSVGGTNQIIDTEAPSGYGIAPSATVPYYVEIVRPTGSLVAAPGEGTTYDITSVSGQTITLAQNLAASVVNGAIIKIRKHWTIGTVFGDANSAGLDTGNATTADTISIYTGAGYKTYYYQTSGLGGIGWRRNGQNSDDTAKYDAIYPDDGMVIAHKTNAVVPVLLTGAVKTGQTSFPITQGLTIATNPYPVNMTLNSSGLWTNNVNTGVSGGSATTADQVSVWNGNGYDTYYYQTSGLGGIGWRLNGQNSTPVGDTALLPSGAAILIQRKNATPFNWVLPQHPTSYN